MAIKESTQIPIDPLKNCSSMKSLFNESTKLIFKKELRH